MGNNNQCLAAQSARQEIINNLDIYDFGQNFVQSFDREEWEKYNIYFTIDNCIKFSRSGIILFRRPIYDVSNLISITLDEYGITLKPFFYNKKKPQTIEEQIRSGLELIFSNQCLKEFFMERIDVKYTLKNKKYFYYLNYLQKDTQKDYCNPGNRKFISQQYLSRKVDVNENDYQSRKSFNLTINTKIQHNHSNDQNIFFSQNSPYKKNDQDIYNLQTQQSPNNFHITRFSPNQNSKDKFQDNQQILVNDIAHNQNKQSSQIQFTQQSQQSYNQQPQNITTVSQFNYKNSQENINQSNNHIIIDENPINQRVLADPQNTQKNNFQSISISQINQQSQIHKPNISQLENQKNFTQNKTIPQINQEQEISQPKIYINQSQDKNQQNIINPSIQQNEQYIVNKLLNQEYESNNPDNGQTNLQNQSQDIQLPDENLFGTFSKNNGQLIHDSSNKTAGFSSQLTSSFQQQQQPQTLKQLMQSQNFSNLQPDQPQQIQEASQYLQRKVEYPLNIQNNSNGFQANQFQTPMKNIQQQAQSSNQNNNNNNNTIQFYNVHSTPFTKDKQNTKIQVNSEEEKQFNSQASQFRAKEFNLNPSQQFETDNFQLQEQQKNVFPLQEKIIAERDSVNHYYDYKNIEKHSNQYEPSKEKGSYANQFQFMHQQQQLQYERELQQTNHKQKNQQNSNQNNQSLFRNTIQNQNLNKFNQHIQQQNEIQFNISPNKSIKSHSRGPIFIENQQPEPNYQPSNQSNDQQQEQVYSSDRSQYFQRQKKPSNSVISSTQLGNHQQVKIQ